MRAILLNPVTKALLFGLTFSVACLAVGCLFGWPTNLRQLMVTTVLVTIIDYCLNWYRRLEVDDAGDAP